MLLAIYERALEATAPERAVQPFVTADLPRDVVAIGKCAGALFDGVAAACIDVGEALVVVPEGYRAPRQEARVIRGGHPSITEASFAAGRALIEFVDRHDDVLFLVSGGGSACAEVPLDGISERELIATNELLVRSGIPIGEMNLVRKHLSAIKGGRLGARVRGRSVTFVFSDVSANALADVASGPTLPDASTNAEAAEILERIGGIHRIVTALRNESLPETVRTLRNSRVQLVADNATLTTAAARIAEERGMRPVIGAGQLEGDVSLAAQTLAARARMLKPGEVLIAGGEPTVVRRGDGIGGRCSELAVRFALAMNHEDIELDALFGSSDGVDGSSGAAGVILHLPAHIDEHEAERALADSDSMPFATRHGEAIMMRPAGNNLRDLYLLARR